MVTSERGGQSRNAARRPLRRVPRKVHKEEDSDQSQGASPSDTQLGPGKETRPRESGYLGISAPPISVPVWKQRKYIDRPADLVALCHDLMSVKVLALDAEFSQPPTRLPDQPSHRLSVLQLAVDHEERASYVVDAQRISDLWPLQAPLQNAGILKLFHSMGSDARVLSTRGLEAVNTVDLEAVSRSLFGQRESGLRSMLLRSCNVWLDKSFQRADWSQRPLSQGMLAYAAQDAEMTLMLYYWLEEHYDWAVRLHHIPAGEALPAVADWILPYLEGSRSRHLADLPGQDGMSTDISLEEQSLRHALAAVHHPPQRARVIRLIADLELRRLAPDLYPYLSSPASEERQSAARGIGRLHDKAALDLIRPLLADPVQEVRQAAILALEQIQGVRPIAAHHPSGAWQPHGSKGLVKWSSDSQDSGSPATGGWQDTLRARFGLSPTAPGDSGQHDKGGD
jgi:3'-5' exonuclease/HEAT repeats